MRDQFYLTTTLNEKISTKEMRPYCKLTVKTSGGKTTFISNDFEGISDLENADVARRWGNLT